MKTNGKASGVETERHEGRGRKEGEGEEAPQKTNDTTESKTRGGRKKTRMKDTKRAKPKATRTRTRTRSTPLETSTTSEDDTPHTRQTPHSIYHINRYTIHKRKAAAQCHAQERTHDETRYDRHAPPNPIQTQRAAREDRATYWLHERSERRGREAANTAATRAEKKTWCRAATNAERRERRTTNGTHARRGEEEDEDQRKSERSRDGAT